MDISLESTAGRVPEQSKGGDRTVTKRRKARDPALHGARPHAPMIIGTPGVGYDGSVDEYVKVGTLQEFRKGRGRAVEVDGVLVAVHRTAGGFVAVTDACPHMGASLADARLLDENTLECHWHHWKYDTKTGKNLGLRPWACLTVYEVKVQGQDVLIKRPPPPAPEPEAEDDEWMTWDPERFFKKKEEP
jgi:nitrite reductase/ring-hydroxylating ferredoxin subunit